MFDLDHIVDLLIDNMKKLFFPEEWIELDLKFSKSEIFTLLYLDKRKEITMTELVDYINSPMSTATGIVDRLVKSGYVLRDRGESDRRIVILRLTEAGTELVQKFKQIITHYISMVLEDLSEEEKQFMISIVLKVIGNMQKMLDSKAEEDTKSKELKTIEIE